MKNKLLSLLTAWNVLPFSKPILGRCTMENIEFFVNIFDPASSKFCEQLDGILKEEEPAGGVAYIGHCSINDFEGMEEASFEVETAQLKRYRLYLFENTNKPPSKKLFDKKVEALTEFIKGVNNG